MDQVSCNNCGELLSFELEGIPRQACPNCGSMSRKFIKHIESSIKLSDHQMVTTVRKEQPIGFTESERPDLTRYASLEPNDNIHLNLRGLAPRNEQDSDIVCENLINALITHGSQVKLEGRGKQDEDFVLAIDGIQIGVQIVRALTDPKFWIELAHSGEIGELKLSIPEAVAALKAAIEHKTSIPLGQRNRLILVLDAYRLPALALGPVTNRFKKEHGDWARSLGFRAVYVVGPPEIFVSRLDI